MLYTKFVRTNRSNTHVARIRARGEGARHGTRTRTDTHETHTRIPQVYARLRTNRYSTHSRSTRTRIVRDGITNRTHADTRSRRRQHRCSLASRRYAYESHRHGNTYAGAADSRSYGSREQGAGAGAGQQVTAQQSTRHDTARQHEAITHDTHETGEAGSRSRIRYACVRITNHIRYARHAWHRAAAQHSTQIGTRHSTARIRTANCQTVSKSHGKRQNVSGTRKKRPGGGVNWIHFPFEGQGENIGCNRQLIYI